MKHIKLYENFDINESFMSDLDVLASESTDINDFVKKVLKSYPGLKNQSNYRDWLEEVYNQCKDHEDEDL